MEPFVAFNSRKRLVLMLLGCLLFVVGSLWMVGAFGEPPQGRGRRSGLAWVGWLGIPFFGALALVAIAKLRDRKPRLVVDEEGILWSSWSGETIPWREIERVVDHQIAGQTVFGVYLHDPARCPPTRWTGRLSVRQRGFGMGDMSINLSGTDRSAEELRAALDSFMRGTRRAAH